MFCSQCGELIAPEANFCSKCGLPVRRLEQPAVNAVGAGGAPVYLSGDQRRQGRTSGTAVTAFVLVFFFSLVGLILGYVARAQIRNSRGFLTGAGLATAAIVIGWISILVSAVFWILVAISASA